MKTDAVRSASLKLEADMQEVMEYVLGQEGEPSMRRLVEDWVSLREMLELPPMHAERNCPHCGRVGFAIATRCGYCWAALLPDSAAPPDSIHQPSEPKPQQEAYNDFENEGGAWYR